MKRRELLDLLDRVLTWPKEKQQAAFDSLSDIEVDYGVLLGRESSDRETLVLSAHERTNADRRRN